MVGKKKIWFVVCLLALCFYAAVAGKSQIP